MVAMECVKRECRRVENRREESRDAHLEIRHALRDLRGPREQVARPDAILILAQIVQQRAYNTRKQ